MYRKNVFSSENNFDISLYFPACNTQRHCCFEESKTGIKSFYEQSALDTSYSQHIYVSFQSVSYT